MHLMGHNSSVLNWIANIFGNVLHTAKQHVAFNTILPTGGATMTLKHDISKIAKHVPCGTNSLKFLISLM